MFKPRHLSRLRHHQVSQEAARSSKISEEDQSVEITDIETALKQLPLAEASLQPTSDEMNDAALASKPIRVWGYSPSLRKRNILTFLRSVFYALALEGAFFFLLSLLATQSPQVMADIPLARVSTIGGIIIITFIYGFIHIYIPLASNIEVTADDESITYYDPSGTLHQLKLQDIAFWQVSRQMFDSNKPTLGNYLMYIFTTKYVYKGDSSLDYCFYQPEKAYLRGKNVVGERRQAYQKGMRLWRAQIARHVGLPRGW